MIFDELAGRYRDDGAPAEQTHQSSPAPDPRRGAESFQGTAEPPLRLDTRTERPPLLPDAPGLGYGPAADERVEDWGVGGDLDPSVPDPSPEPVTDPAHPDYVQPWRPGGAR